jgi:hypothetical protein
VFRKCEHAFVACTSPHWTFEQDKRSLMNVLRRPVSDVSTNILIFEDASVLRSFLDVPQRVPLPDVWLALGYLLDRFVSVRLFNEESDLTQLPFVASRSV